MDRTFCVVKNYGTEEAETIASGLNDLEMLMYVKQMLEGGEEKLTVCMENATQEEADAWKDAFIKRSEEAEREEETKIDE